MLARCRTFKLEATLQEKPSAQCPPKCWCSRGVRSLLQEVFHCSLYMHWSQSRPGQLEGYHLRISTSRYLYEGRIDFRQVPVEILYDIQSIALSSSLPLTCKHLYSVFKSAPYTVHAEYLVGRCLAEVERHPRANPVSTVLRYPLCNQNVLHAVLRNPHFPTMNLAHKMMGTELPRRLFRSLAPRSDTNQAGKRKRRSDEGGSWTEGGEPILFLQYLFSHESIPPPRPDSFDGYALTKAVQVGDIPLVRFLLDHGASPQHKDGLAVKVAIRRKDLRLVRLLIERDDRVRAEKRRGTDSSNLGEGSRQANGSHRAVTGQGSEGDVIPPEYRSVKRRKLEDRIKPTVAMLRMAVQSDARDIVEYLMKVKGCVPDMKTVLMIMNGRK